MSARIITENQTITDIHIVWDGVNCFLNKKRNRRIIDDARLIELSEAREIVTEAVKNPNAQASNRGIVSFDNPTYHWSWMATIIEDDESESI